MSINHPLRVQVQFEIMHHDPSCAAAQAKNGKAGSKASSAPAEAEGAEGKKQDKAGPPCDSGGLIWFARFPDVSGDPWAPQCWGPKLIYAIDSNPSPVLARGGSRHDSDVEFTRELLSVAGVRAAWACWMALVASWSSLVRRPRRARRRGRPAVGATQSTGGSWGWWRDGVSGRGNLAGHAGVE